MITADSDELFMLIEGETLGGRYRVKTVGPDLVELTDLVTAGTPASDSSRITAVLKSVQPS